jgi:hypothetical protein
MTSSYRLFGFAVLLAFVGCVGEVVPGEGLDGGRPGGDGGDGSGFDGGSGGGAGDGGLPQDGGDGGGGGSDGGNPSLRGAFVAIGYAARTTISCDDGRTWIANQSGDDNLRCFEPQPDGGNGDCDHKYEPGRGITFGNGTFLANFGWGDPGTLRRSTDGVNWQVVERGKTYASSAYGNGRFVAINNETSVSVNGGTAWTSVYTPANSNVRRGAFGGADGGVFVLVADGPYAARSVDGLTWTAATTLPSNCGQNIQWSGGIASANGALVMVGGNGYACRSTDNGATWVGVSMGGSVTGRLVHTGTVYQTYGTSPSGQSVRFQSVDGLSWTTTPLQLRVRNADGSVTLSNNGPLIGPVARSGSGAWVGVNEGWQVWYEQQRFYRSDDGVIWEQLAPGTFAPSHPMTHIIWAETLTSACP